MSRLKETALKISAIINRNHKSKILFYHDVFSNERYTDMGTPQELFGKHIDMIRKCGFEITPEISKNEDQIQICFDDGFRGIWDTRKYFIDNDIKPTIFLAVELIGEKGYLKKDEILELQDNGFIFQSHAWSHKNLTGFNGKELEHEIKGSMDFLSDILGKPVKEICFPIGYFSKNVYNECRRWGYETMYSS
ncbi:MAG: polysaccharide deacetylase family protein, partial [Bacteroidales bacterium]